VEGTDRTGRLIADLVAMDSVNPSLVTGAAGEAEIAALIARRCEAIGLEVRLQDAAPGRPNVIATRRGTEGGRSLLLNGHTDTVGHGGMGDPPAAAQDGDRLTGRGAYDMKGSLAAMLLAAEALADDVLAGDLILAFVADEEHASVGTEALVREVSADLAIITEPTELTLAVAHKGFVWAQVETRGRAAHGSRPDEGVDAIVGMGPVLTGLGEVERTLAAGGRHPLLGSASVHASLIAGGVELSTYPDRCLLDVERRTIPGETRQSVEAELARLLDRAREALPGLQVELRMGIDRQPFEIDPAHELVALASAAVARETGSAPTLTGGSGWMDSALLAAAGIPTVILGPSGDGAHADHEWVSVTSVGACARIYADVARAVCG